MNFIKGTSTQILDGSVPVETFELGHTGLGYYINPKPVIEPTTTGTVNVDSAPAQTFVITRESERHNWYVLFHLQSRRSIGLLFFSEQQARKAVKELSSLIDWTLDDNALLAQQEAWERVGQKIVEIRRTA